MLLESFFTEIDHVRRKLEFEEIAEVGFNWCLFWRLCLALGAVPLDLMRELRCTPLT